jgi:hypothetical protein
MLPDELGVARQQTAEVLRPRAVDRTIQDHVADAAGARLLGRGRKAEKRVDLALGEQVHWCRGHAGDPVNIVESRPT